MSMQRDAGHAQYSSQNAYSIVETDLVRHIS